MSDRATTSESPQRLSSLEMVVLKLLSNAGPYELWPLEIVRRSGGRVGQATIYVTLRRLTAKGLIDSTYEVVSGQRGGPRRFYAMTDKGVIVLDGWLKFEEQISI